MWGSRRGQQGVNWGGAWSVATAYAPHDAVTWAGSSYVALVAVAAGGTPPSNDPTRWQRIAQGGGEIAYADYTAADMNLTSGLSVDIPGLSIVVPARSGTVKLRGAAACRHTATAVGAAAITTLLLYDIDVGAVLKQNTFRTVDSVNAQVMEDTLYMEQRITDSATARSFKLMVFAQMVNATTKVLGPGTAAVQFVPFLEAISR